MTWQADRPLQVLVVCTANQCRSPMAERLLARRLEQSGIPATVGSAGFLRGGVPAAEGAVDALGNMGLDLSDHRSRTIDADLLAAADITITMEGTHVVDIVTTWTGHGGRAIRLHDAVDGANLLAGEPVRTPDVVRRWAEYLHSAAGNSVFDNRRDVPDPMGRSKRAFQASAASLDDQLSVVVGAWAGTSPIA